MIECLKVLKPQEPKTKRKFPWGIVPALINGCQRALADLAA
jgi:hypothetical protein